MATVLARNLSERGLPTRVVEHLEDANIVWMCGLEAMRQLTTNELTARIVAAPVFAGETGPVYRSLYVQHQERTDDNRWVFNEEQSWSGHHAAMADRRSKGLPAIDPMNKVWSGSHVASLVMVRDGKAGISPIDSSVWAWQKDTFPDLVVSDSTPDWPAPPILIRPTADAAAVEEALGSATLQEDGLTRLAPASRDQYLPMYQAARY